LARDRETEVEDYVAFLYLHLTACRRKMEKMMVLEMSPKIKMVHI
jgi:hypothetical protein